MTRRIWLLLGMLLLIIASLAGTYLLSIAEPYEERIDRGPSPEARANEYLAAELFLRQQGRSVSRADGLDVLKRLRARKSAQPVLILTAQDGVDDRVRGLDAGADDYLTKPFALPELEARVRALTRRGTGQPRCIEIGQLSYDQADRVVKIGGQLVDLSAREIGLLEIFLLRVGRLVSKDQLVDHLCGWGEEVSSNAIEVYVHRLRKKLEDSGVRIVTVRGLGYCLENPDAVATAKA